MRSALLLLDFQVGLGDQAWSVAAVAAAQEALAAARTHGLLVVFSRVAFDPGYLDVSSASRAFAPYRDQDLLPAGASRIVEDLAPRAGEAVVTKDRFSPFAGSNLRAVLRSQEIAHVVLAGVSTSGVVLAAFTDGENHDTTMTVLSDSCADPDAALHDCLVGRLFPRSATVTTTDSWIRGITS